MAPKTDTTKKKRKHGVGTSYQYKRKTNRQSWSEADMSRALRAIEEKECGYLKAAALFNVPKTTLETDKGHSSKRQASIISLHHNQLCTFQPVY